MWMRLCDTILQTKIQKYFLAKKEETVKKDAVAPGHFVLVA